MKWKSIFLSLTSILVHFFFSIYNESYKTKEQYAYMVSLKKALDANGPCVLEMPSGTGKTVSLLSLITSYQVCHPEVGKLIYCSRTIPEIEQAIREAKRVTEYRISEMGNNAPKTLVLGMSSRKNLCIHPRVSELKDNKQVDSACHDMTAAWIREQKDTENSDPLNIELCSFFEEFDKSGREILLNGVYSLEDLKSLGKKHSWCPYYLARRLVNLANVVIFSYQYIIDPKISDLVTKEIKGDSIVVFDEAHNIDNVCIEALSVRLDNEAIHSSNANITKLQQEIQRAKDQDERRLREEYNRLLSGLNNRTPEQQESLAINNEVIQDSLPQSIKKADTFVDTLKKMVTYIHSRFKVDQVVVISPQAFLNDIKEKAGIDHYFLKATSMGLQSLITTLQLQNVDQFTPLQIVSQFATLIGTYSDGFTIIIEPFDEKTPNIPDPKFQFICLDSSIAMKPVVAKFKSIVITSGTISPLDIYPKLLGFIPVLSERLHMSLARDCVCPLIISKGNDQSELSTKFELRDNENVIRNFGNLLVEMALIVPDGIVCFFVSYYFMEQTVATWNEMGILKQVVQNKLLFVETSDLEESSTALQNYKLACDNGRGAVLLAIARGKISEGIDFDNQYGRCVILFGIPFMNTQSRVLRARMEYLSENLGIRENEFLTFDAMRCAAQCVGRVIRGKTDYGIMVFADKRYGRRDKREKLPQWVSSTLKDSSLDLSIDMGVYVAKKFLKSAAQPMTLTTQLGKSLWSFEHLKKHQESSQKIILEE